jgi:hypothetical protein
MGDVLMKLHHPLVEFWDDEREIGNGIIVTLKPGGFFYDDCGVMGFDTVREAKARIEMVAAARDAEAEGWL